MSSYRRIILGCAVHISSQIYPNRVKIVLIFCPIFLLNFEPYLFVFGIQKGSENLRKVIWNPDLFSITKFEYVQIFPRMPFPPNHFPKGQNLGLKGWNLHGERLF